MEDKDKTTPRRSSRLQDKNKEVYTETPKRRNKRVSTNTDVGNTNDTLSKKRGRPKKNKTSESEEVELNENRKNNEKNGTEYTSNSGMPKDTPSDQNNSQEENKSTPKKRGRPKKSAIKIPEITVENNIQNLENFHVVHSKKEDEDSDAPIEVSSKQTELQEQEQARIAKEKENKLKIVEKKNGS